MTLVTVQLDSVLLPAKGEASPDILPRQLGEFFQDFRLDHLILPMDFAN